MKDADRRYHKTVTAAAVEPELAVGGLYLFNQEEQVARLIDEVGFVDFLQKLSSEIILNYRDPDISSLDRGESFEKNDSTLPQETFETMGCRAVDFAIFKLIGSDPERPKRGLQTVYGDMYCVESRNGQMRLMCPAGYTTMLRTATASAIALTTLKPEAETLSVIGAGQQGEAHALVMAVLSPPLRKIYLRDLDEAKASATAQDLNAEIKEYVGQERADEIDIEVAQEGDHRLETDADAIVTATFGTEEVLSSTNLKEGVVIAAVGTDMPDAKRELSPDLYGRAKFVADDLRQSLYEGELQHALRQLGITKKDRRAVEFRGSLLGGRVIGLANLLEDPNTFRQRPESITIYDSTGWAGQDLAVARVMLRLLQTKGYSMLPSLGPRSRKSVVQLLSED